MFKVRVKCDYGSGWHYHEDEQLTLNSAIICPTHPAAVISDFVIIDQYETTGVFKLTGSSDSPMDLDFTLYGFHKEEIIDNLGLITTVNFYRSYDGVTYSDLVVKDDFTYIVDSNDLVKSRDETISWVLSDESIGMTKTSTKYYNIIDAVTVGVKRRTNLLNKAKAYAMSTIIGMHDALDGTPIIPNSHYFFTLCANEANLYLNGIKDYLIDFITNSTEIYIDATIRATLLAILKYW